MAKTSILDRFLWKLQQAVLGTNYEDWRSQIWPKWTLRGQFGHIWPNLAQFGQNLNFEARYFKFVSNVGFHVSRKSKGSDWGYLTFNGPNWPKVGQIWPNLIFQARIFKFALKVGFYASRKPKDSDLGYLAFTGPNWPRFGQFWPNLPKYQFWSWRLQIRVGGRISCIKKAKGLGFGLSDLKWAKLAQCWPNLANLYF